LKNLDRKDEAREAYQQVIDGKNPNPYRDDARAAAGSILLARGKKSEALKQYEALSNETGKPALKAEAAVRAGLIAVDLQRDEKGKTDKALTEKATGLLQKAKAIRKQESGVGLRRPGYCACNIKPRNTPNCW
jgi:hypothetical protein